MKIILPDLPDNLVDLEKTIQDGEKRLSNLKTGAEARIVWADPENKIPTTSSLVYLHGFTASQGEGYPLHRDFAHRYGLNLYLSRLSGHGLQEEAPLDGLQPADLVESAARALAVGKKLGKKVILMGTSTGASLALYLAAETDEQYLQGLILYSPLIDFFGIKSLLLSNGWMRPLLTFIPGKRYIVKTKIGHPDEAKIWYTRYRLEGVLALGELIEATMTRQSFSKIRLPVFTGYYYKNSSEQDKVVSVTDILKMHEQLSTPEHQKQIANFPKAGSHVICSSLLSKDIGQVKRKTFDFADTFLRLKPL